MSRSHIAVLIVLTLLFRWQTWNLPLNRDEGVYAYAASRLFDSDFVLYRDIFDHKPPGIQLLYWASFALIGETELSVRLLGFLNAAGATVLIYLIIYFLTKEKKKSLIYSGLYSYLSNSFILEGQLANTEMFMTTFLTAGLYSQMTGRPLLAGLLSGFAILLKPVAIPNVVILSIYPIVIEGTKGFKKIIPFFVGFSLPIVSVIAWFKSKNSLVDFYNQVILFNKFYVQSGLSDVGKKINLFSWIIRSHLFIKIIILSSITILIRNWKKRSVKYLIILGVWIASFYIGAKITSRNVLHYYFPMVSAYVLFASVSNEKKIITATVVLFSILWGWYIFLSPRTAYEKTFGSTVRYAYEARDIGELIREKTSPDDKIFFWYDDPEVLFYAKRNPTTKYANTFGIVIPGATEELKSGLEKNPKVIITYELTDWIRQYLNTHNYRVDTSFSTAKIYWRND